MVLCGPEPVILIGELSIQGKISRNFYLRIIVGHTWYCLSSAKFIFGNKFIEITSIIFCFLGLKTRKVHGKLLLQQNNTVVQCKQFGINVKSMDIKILFSNTIADCTKMCRNTYIQYV